VKPFFALAALEEQIISPQKEIESTGSLKLANPYRPGEFSVFNDWKAHGWTDMRKAIAVSSDVYFYQIGGGFTGQQGLGIERIDKYSKMFGFSTVIENSFFTGKKGNIPTPEWKKETFGGDIWRVGDTYNTSIGQYGFQVTPIQAVRAVAALANGGKLLEPTIQLEDKAAIGRATTVSVQNPEYYKVIREGMRMTVTDGTAQSINVPYVNVAAKTGTAQVGTRNQYINSWVVGFSHMISQNMPLHCSSSEVQTVLRWELLQPSDFSLIQ
jgi:penicillin-binding protein 2